MFEIPLVKITLALPVQSMSECHLEAFQNFGKGKRGTVKLFTPVDPRFSSLLEFQLFLNSKCESYNRIIFPRILKMSWI